MPVLLALLAGYLFLERSVMRELTALVEEELAEAMVLLQRTAQPRRDFQDLARQLSEQHPTVTMAWRLRDQATGETVSSWRASPLSGRTWPVPTLGDPPREIETGVFVKATAGPGGTEIDLLLDGRRHIDAVSRFELTALGIAALCVLLAAVAGGILARRISRMLDSVVASVKEGDRDGAAAPDQLIDQLPREIHHMAVALQRTLAEIRRESEEARVLTMSLAHELRSPVQNLMGQAEVALMRTREPGEYAQVLGGQLEELMQFSDAIDNLLTIFAKRAEENGHRENFDLGEEARLRLQREERRGARNGVEVVIETSGDLRIGGDRESLMRGVRNLVANAVDWSPVDRRVQVTLEGTAEGISVTVDDAGPGVSPAIREQVFEAFFQGPSPNMGRVGYGLGLAMTRKAVEAQGGSIRVEESPAGGARFRVQLPRVRPGHPDSTATLES